MPGHRSLRQPGGKSAANLAGRFFREHPLRRSDLRPPGSGHIGAHRAVGLAKVLLDTDICIAAIRGHAGVTGRMAQLAPGDCVVSVLSVYELFVAVAKSKVPVDERTRVERLLASVWVAIFDEAAARCAARVRAGWERSGSVCGPVDMLLAGHALSLGANLATGNVREFSRVTGLRVENWLA